MANKSRRTARAKKRRRSALARARTRQFAYASGGMLKNSAFRAKKSGETENCARQAPFTSLTGLTKRKGLYAAALRSRDWTQNKAALQNLLKHRLWGETDATLGLYKSRRAPADIKKTASLFALRASAALRRLWRFALRTRTLLWQPENAGAKPLLKQQHSHFTRGLNKTCSLNGAGA